MGIRSFLMFFLIGTILGCGPMEKDPLEGKVICIDPGHGGTAATDSYRVGPTGEREEWVNLRVALELGRILERHGARVVLTRTSDSLVPLEARAQRAKEERADIFVSIHHNATADPQVNFPIIYFHGNASENRASVRLGRLVGERLGTTLHSDGTPVSLVSDFVIFPSRGASVLRHSYGIPGIIGEASFFTHPKEEERLKDLDHNRREAQAYYEAIKEFFSDSIPAIRPLHSQIKLPPFPVFQEAERMDPVALLWQRDFERGSCLARAENRDSLVLADSLLRRSVRSFPDSWVAREAHRQRSGVLRKLGQTAQADTLNLRVMEMYVGMDSDTTKP